MYIVMFSINPLFPNTIMGGAPKHLQNVAIYLGKMGHRVSVLCTKPDDKAEPFLWHENVEVLPVLRFKQPFPQPYEVPAYQIADAIQQVGDYLQKADRFYMHDGEFLFPYVYQHIPTVISLRDNVYPETLIGSFLFQGDRLILISDYSRQYFLHTVGRFFPGLKDRIEVIHNGVDWEKFKPVSPGEILKIIPVDPTVQPIVLHPHRPEASKGIQQTIAVADRLVNRYGFKKLKVLAPKWLDVQLTADLKAFYDNIEQSIREYGLQENFIFHDWIPQRLMPEYYSLGTVTLSLGNFVESFGNSVYESLGCGTPSIAARISTHRELLPDSLLDKVDFDDIDKAAEIAARIIQNRERTRPEVTEYLRVHYSVQQQLDRYANVILNAKVAAPLIYHHSSFDSNTCFTLAPWCCCASDNPDRVYHDFLAVYRDLKPITSLIKQYPQGFTISQAEKLGVSSGYLQECYHEGFLVPFPHV